MIQVSQGFCYHYNGAYQLHLKTTDQSITAPLPANGNQLTTIDHSPIRVSTLLLHVAIPTWLILRTPFGMVNIDHVLPPTQPIRI